LLPCHALFQFYVAGSRLSCQIYQRSADALLGVPFNIASYALLTHMLAQQCDFQVGEFIWTGGDCHLYLNHLEQADLQLGREPYPLPRLEIRRRPQSVFDYAYEDFEILDYRSHSAIKAPIAVLRKPRPAVLPCSKCVIPPSTGTACLPCAASARARPSSNISATA